jgi:hypothetical protein
MRPSMASHRASYAAGLTSKAPNPAASLKLLEKKKEFDAVSALEKSTALFLERIEGLGEDCDIMANAAHGESSIYPFFRSQTDSFHANSTWQSARAVAKDVRDIELVS